MLKAPRIGITLDSEQGGSYSSFPWYALRENYCTTIKNAGGIPILLPPETELLEDYISLIDGLLITGGDFDIDPLLFGETDRHPTIKTKPKRTQFEKLITKQALEKDYPILGICGGEQLLNVIFGGTLIQHIPDMVPNCLSHAQSIPRDEPSHSITIKNSSLLYNIIQQEELNVNSTHHQAIKKLGDGVIANAIAPDGVIEGIEVPSYSFCLGVQWHPEYLISSADQAIFEAFLEAARRKN